MDIAQLEKIHNIKIDRETGEITIPMFHVYKENSSTMFADETVLNLARAWGYARTKDGLAVLLPPKQDLLDFPTVSFHDIQKLETKEGRIAFQAKATEPLSEGDLVEHGATSKCFTVESSCNSANDGTVICREARIKAHSVRVERDRINKYVKNELPKVIGVEEAKTYPSRYNESPILREPENNCSSGDFWKLFDGACLFYVFPRIGEE